MKSQAPLLFSEAAQVQMIPVLIQAAEKKGPKRMAGILNQAAEKEGASPLKCVSLLDVKNHAQVRTTLILNQAAEQNQAQQHKVTGILNQAAERKGASGQRAELATPLDMKNHARVQTTLILNQAGE